LGALVAGRLGGSLHCKLGAKEMNIIELAKQKGSGAGQVSTARAGAKLLPPLR